MALPGSGSISLKNAAGAGRSISQEVDGNETGNKSLTTLSTTAGKTAPHGMLEFYGYSANITTTVNWSLGPYTINSGVSFRNCTVDATLSFTNSSIFTGGTFGVQILRYVSAISNQVGADAEGRVRRTTPGGDGPTLTTTNDVDFGDGFIQDSDLEIHTVGTGTSIIYELRSSETGGAGASVAQAVSSVRITSVWVQNTVIPTASGLTQILVVT